MKVDIETLEELGRLKKENQIRNGLIKILCDSAEDDNECLQNLFIANKYIASWLEDFYDCVKIEED